MLKTIWDTGKRAKASIATPLFMILEVIMEMIIPLYIVSIIDDGVGKGDSITSTWWERSWWQQQPSVCLPVSWAENMEQKRLPDLQEIRVRPCLKTFCEYSFSNIDKFSTAGLVTSPDDRRHQPAECLSDDSSYVHACTVEHIADDYVVLYQCTSCKRLSGSHSYPRNAPFYHASGDEIFHWHPKYR